MISSNEVRSLELALGEIENALNSGTVSPETVKTCGGREYDGVRKLTDKLLDIAQKIQGNLLTTAQLAALNSGITAAELSTMLAGITNAQNKAYAAKATADNSVQGQPGGTFTVALGDSGTDTALQDFINTLGLNLLGDVIINVTGTSTAPLIIPAFTGNGRFNLYEETAAKQQIAGAVESYASNRTINLYNCSIGDLSVYGSTLFNVQNTATVNGNLITDYHMGATVFRSILNGNATVFTGTRLSFRTATAGMTGMLTITGGLVSIEKTVLPANFTPTSIVNNGGTIVDDRPGISVDTFQRKSGGFWKGVVGAAGRSGGIDYNLGISANGAALHLVKGRYNVTTAGNPQYDAEFTAQFYGVNNNRSFINFNAAFKDVPADKPIVYCYTGDDNNTHLYFKTSRPDNTAIYPSIAIEYIIESVNSSNTKIMAPGTFADVDANPAGIGAALSDVTTLV